MSAALLSHGTSGWRRMVPVDEHGASSSTASNVLRRPIPRHRRRRSRRRATAARDFRRAAQPRRRAVDGGDERAGGGKLRGLAARRGAQIGDALSANVAEQPRRQRRRGVLHPPCAFGKTGQRGDRAMRDRAHRAGRQHAAAELCRPDFRVALHREIERRLVAVGGGDGVRGRRAVSRGPARHQPVGRVERRQCRARRAVRAFARDAPQHRVDQAGKARRVPVGLRQPHRKIDGGVIGHVEKQDLRGAEKQRGLDARRLRRQAAFEQRPMQMAQGAEPAQHGRDQRARERAVAILERGELARRVEQLVERAAAAQHAVEDIGGDAAHGEAGHVVGARPGRGLRSCARLCTREILLAGAAGLRQVTGECQPIADSRESRRPTDAAPNRQAGKPPISAGGRTRARRSCGAPRRTRAQAGRPPKEVGGRGGLDPTRYGDWEINGLTRISR